VAHPTSAVAAASPRLEIALQPNTDTLILTESYDCLLSNDLDLVGDSLAGMRTQDAVHRIRRTPGRLVIMANLHLSE